MMNLTPIEVEQKAFTQALRGYQMDEVDDFLDEVVNALRSYEQRLHEAQEKIRAIESDPVRIRGAGADESEISRAILTAQRSADRLVSEAKAEAALIRDETEAETTKLAANRDAERTRLLGEITGMRQLVGDLRSKLSEISGVVGGQVDAMESHLDETDSAVARTTFTMADDADLDQTEADQGNKDAGVDDDDDEDDDDEDNVPSFNQIFPGETVDLSEERGEAVPEPVGRISRPWERG
jgi:cell division initiation protein